MTTERNVSATELQILSFVHGRELAGRAISQNQSTVFMSTFEQYFSTWNTRTPWGSRVVHIDLIIFYSVVHTVLSHNRFKHDYYFQILAKA